MTEYHAIPLLDLASPAIARRQRSTASLSSPATLIKSTLSMILNGIAPRGGVPFKNDWDDSFIEPENSVGCDGRQADRQAGRH